MTYLVALQHCWQWYFQIKNAGLPLKVSVDLYWVSKKSGNKKFVPKLSGIRGRPHVPCAASGLTFASRTCFKRLSIVVSSRISDLSPSSISGTRTLNSLHTLSRRFLSCCADCASLIHCSSLFSLLNLTIKSSSTPSTAAPLLSDSPSTGFSSGGGAEGGESMKIISFSTRGFCGTGCSMTSSSLSCALLFPFTKGLKTFHGSINYCSDSNMRKTKRWEAKTNIYLFQSPIKSTIVQLSSETRRSLNQFDRLYDVVNWFPQYKYRRWEMSCPTCRLSRFLLSQ